MMKENDKIEKSKLYEAVVYDRFFELRGMGEGVFAWGGGMAVWAQGTPVWIRVQGDGGEFVSEFLAGHEPRQVVAEREVAEAVRRIWAKRHGGGIRCLLREMTAYYLPDGVELPGAGALPDIAVSGCLRKPEGAQEYSLIAGWMKEFYHGDLTERSAAGTEADEYTASTPAKPDLRVWVDAPASSPVAMGAIMPAHSVKQATAGDFAAAAATRRLNLIFVPPEHRRAGYGRAVVTALCRIVRKEGCVPMLYAYADNNAACRLYEGLGFAEAGRLVEVTALF